MDPDLNADSHLDIGESDYHRLFRACIDGNLKIVTECVSRCVDIHVKRDFPLKLACSNGRLNIVKFIFNLPSGKDIDVDSAMLSAVDSGSLEIVKFLVGRGANILHRNFYPVRLAASSGRVSIARYFILLYPHIDLERTNALSSASVHGHLKTVRFLTSRFDYEKSEDKSLALIGASMNGHLPVVKFLVGRAGSHSRATIDLALIEACANGHGATMRCLLRNGGEISPSLYRVAGAKCNTKMMDFVSENIDAKYRPDIEAEKNIVFRESVLSGNVDMLAYLLESRIKLDRITRENIFQISVLKGDLNIVELIVNIALVNVDMDSALQVAVEEGFSDVAEYLVSEGADVGAGNYLAVRTACALNNFGLVKFLVRNGAKMYDVDLFRREDTEFLLDLRLPSIQRAFRGRKTSMFYDTVIVVMNVRRAMREVTRDIRNRINSDVCMICYDNNLNLEIKECGHGFHRRCFDRWGRNRCPYCSRVYGVGL